MKRSTRAFLIWFSVAAFVAVAFVLGVRVGTGLGGVPTSGRRVLSLRVEGAYPDQDPAASVNRLLGVRRVTLRDLVRSLDHAAQDESIAGLQLRVGPLDMGWARAQEIRAAISRFRASGKPVHAFMELGDDGSYFLASAAERIRMVPSSTLWLDGISADVPFYGGTLGKVGVQADLEQVGPYKNAADALERSSMSPEHRQAMDSLLDGLFGELADTLAEALGRPRQEVEELISGGPYSAQDALAAGLVHALGYEDEAAADLDAEIGRPLPRIRLDRYLPAVPEPSGRSAIAIVHCAGEIVSGESSDGLFGSAAMGADTIARAIAEARRDGASAVVLRVDSPGGSATASDIIWRETMRTREAGLPVVVSMGDVAASGGYWISMGADKVLAEPSTLTGSIGIYGGKYVLQGLHGMIGLGVEPVERGENSGLMSSRRPFTDAQRAWLQAQLQGVYRLFIERVADGRGFPSAQAVDAIAQGRVWTGRQALDNGLVDALGGLRDAVEAAKQLAGLPASAPVSLREYPRAPTLLEMFRDGGPATLLGAAFRQVAAEEIRGALPAQALSDAGGIPGRRLLEGGVLAWTPFSVRAR